MKTLASSVLLMVILFNASVTTAQPQKPAPATLREGKHNFTLQWISWDNPGKVTITKQTDSTYSVKGEQRSYDDSNFVSIDGVLKVINARELIFDGVIFTQVTHINEGKVCERKGTYHFLAKGTRRYWRLQEMDNCGGAGHATDYVDIYFD